MAAKPRVRLNRSGVLALMQRAGPPLLREKAEAVCGRLRAAGYQADYEMRQDRNGRPVVMVALTEARGLTAQAKDGVVTKAAAMEGLDINRYYIR
ncbi:hypothetical protein G6031_09630 [Dietzia sp. CQ4]|uniref:hypothetical protein n=1 Tax=Dietzia sp. (strain CQ4) TaxID=370437 RepID=UPI0015F7D58E|nr:hypothetical protein [Dietzia sp. CQ4]MBB1034648.1 hypothetical protein [Dietzia sp. CQ4]